MIPTSHIFSSRYFSYNMKTFWFLVVVIVYPMLHIQSHELTILNLNSAKTQDAYLDFQKNQSFKSKFYKSLVSVQTLTPTFWNIYICKFKFSDLNLSKVELHFRNSDAPISFHFIQVLIFQWNIVDFSLYYIEL